MNELHLQRALRSGWTLNDLDDQLGIKSTRHTEHSNLISFTYRHTGCDWSEPMVCEARGVILDEANDWRCVARAFDKFFNDGEPFAAEIDWSAARVQEKLDGSLCILYFYAGKWHVATRGTPDGSGTVPFGAGLTFHELFWRTFESMSLRLPQDGGDTVYMFELTSPKNRVVVRYLDEALTLIGVRDMRNHEECYITDAWRMVFGPGLRIVGEEPLKNIDAVRRRIERNSDPLASEGFVVVDDCFRRIKVKDPAYVALHRLAGGLSYRRMLEIVMAGEESEVLSAFPEYADDIERAKAQWDALNGQIDAEYREAKKQWAEIVKTTSCPGAIFSVGSGKAKSVREWLTGLPIQKVEALVSAVEVPSTDP